MKVDVVRVVWSLCFLAGAGNDARDLVLGGWLPYEFMPLAFNIYWTALLPLDLLTAIPVWIVPRAGAGLGLAIMLGDVAVNFWTIFAAGFREMLPGFVLQSIFCLFVVLTFRTIVVAPALRSQES